MSAATTPADPGTTPVQPVLLGADIGVYALARAFHAQYGVRSVVIAGDALGPIADSRILDVRLVADGHDPRQLVDAALRVAAEHEAAGRPGRLLLLANSDWLVRVVVQHRAELEAHYVVPFLSEDLLDRLSDKASFAEAAVAAGLAVPRTIVQDFARAGEPDWAPEPVDIAYPLIAKAASSADYQEVEFPGKAKVFEIQDADELAALWVSLREAGFRGRFVVQDLVPGDDTQMRSITAYVDANGVITLLCSAHVLLEEHTPSGLGNPAAMVVGREPAMLEQAAIFLREVGYVGFANFDVKVDPRDGTARFFEVNPRIGRNNFYVTAAGANVARFVTEDRVLGHAVEPVVVGDEQAVLYSILPHRLLLRYVLDPALAARVRSLISAGRVAHPLRYRADAGLKRRWYTFVAGLNQVRKFRRYYPKVTGTGF